MNGGRYYRVAHGTGRFTTKDKVPAGRGGGWNRSRCDPLPKNFRKLRRGREATRGGWEGQLGRGKMARFIRMPLFSVHCCCAQASQCACSRQVKEGMGILSASRSRQLCQVSPVHVQRVFLRRTLRLLQLHGAPPVIPTAVCANRRPSKLLCGTPDGQRHCREQKHVLCCGDVHSGTEMVTPRGTWNAATETRGHNSRIGGGDREFGGGHEEVRRCL